MTMLKTWPFLWLLSLFVGCTMRKRCESDATPQYLRLYESALNSGDINIKITALYFLTEFSADSLKYRDSLAKAYYDIRAFDQCIHWSLKAYKYSDTNRLALSLLGRSYLKKQDFSNSILYLERLIQPNPQPANYLPLIESQYRFKRLYECLQSCDLALQMNEDRSSRYFYTDTAGKISSTSIKPALYNFKGLAYYELNKTELAELSFIEALKIDPEFVLPAINLKIIRLQKQ